MPSDLTLAEIHELEQRFDADRPASTRPPSNAPEIVSASVESSRSLLAVVFAERDRTHHSFVFSAVVGNRINQLIWDAIQKFDWLDNLPEGDEAWRKSFENTFPPPFSEVCDPNAILTVVSASILGSEDGSTLTLRLDTGEDCHFAMDCGVTVFLFMAIKHHFKYQNWIDPDGNLATRDSSTPTIN